MLHLLSLSGNPLQQIITVSLAVKEVFGRQGIECMDIQSQPCILVFGILGASNLIDQDDHKDTQKSTSILRRVELEPRHR